MFSLPRAWIQSLVGELRSCKPYGMAKQTNSLKKNFFFKLYFWLCWVFIAVLGFPPAVERGAALQVRRPLTAVASLVQHGLEAHGLQQVQQAGSGVVARGL